MPKPSSIIHANKPYNDINTAKKDSFEKILSQGKELKLLGYTLLQFLELHYSILYRLIKSLAFIESIHISNS